MAPEDLPKGVRKEVVVSGKSVLLFWYRNEIYCIDSRSPAEGAYSEGFIKAKFTQDFGIECPTTKSTFSLKDGSVLDLYPTNPVLKALTPVDTIPKLGLYKVQVKQDAIYISVDEEGSTTYVSRGGADSSIDKNNVYSVEPKMYLEGAQPDRPFDQTESVDNTAGKVTIGLAWSLVGLVAVASAYAAIKFVIENA